MRASRLMDMFRSHAVAAFGDRDLEDDLLRHLVVSVFAVKSSLYASIAMACAIVAVAAMMEWRAAFFALAGLQAIVGVARLSIAGRFDAARAEGLSRVELRSFDFVFTFWSAAQAMVLGACFCALETPSASAVGLPLAVGGAVGFCVAFVTRSAGRLRLLISQVAGVVAPVVFGLIAFHPPYAGAYVALFVGLALCTLFMGLSVRQRLIDVFRVNDANRRMANFDMLTGLANRFAFNAALAGALGASRRPIALVTVDLDRFKQVNDSAGHLVGDLVLVETARRLREVAGRDDLVARLGGDEFVILAARGEGGLERVEGLARRLVRSIAQPYEGAGATHKLGCSVGVALSPEHGDTAEELMKRSDIALYEAKIAGRGVVRMFDVSMQLRFDDARRVELALEAAVRDDQFEAWFQPIVDLRQGAIVGYEALARWRHPELGVVPPDRFIPIAERTGLIAAIGRKMLVSACRAARDWPAHVTIAVNISPAEFRNADELSRTVFEALAETGLEPARLYLEVTESEMLQNTIPVRVAIHRLRAAGVRFALDDFGAGYSSLSYIQDYPFARIKIDRKFVSRLGDDAISPAIVASVCALAERLGLEVVAEGVETRAQQATLKALGVTLAQGFLYGKPRPQGQPATARVWAASG